MRDGTVLRENAAASAPCTDAQPRASDGATWAFRGRARRDAAAGRVAFRPLVAAFEGRRDAAQPDDHRDGQHHEPTRRAEEGGLLVRSYTAAAKYWRSSPPLPHDQRA